MGKVKFDISISLDGYVAGPDNSDEHPMGKGGMALHEWVFGLRSWREPHGLEGGETGPDDEVMAEMSGGVGANVVSRRMFDLTDGWGEKPPFPNPVFVVTHRIGEPDVRGDTTFHFVEGVEAAVAQAAEAAGDGDVYIAGGASVAQQALAAGLVDQMQLHVVPLLLGDGRRLLENLGDRPPRLEVDRVVPSPAVTHIRYRVLR